MLYCGMNRFRDVRCFQKTSKQKNYLKKKRFKMNFKEVNFKKLSKFQKF